MNMKKYLATIGILVGILLLGGIFINFLISSFSSMFEVVINIIVVSLVSIILFSTFITSRILHNKKVSSSLMSINLKIVGILFPIIISIASTVGIPKNYIRNIYVKLNNKYIYSNKYNLRCEDILVLIPHCVQKNSCKLKVTTNIDNCKTCGLCNIGDLVGLKETFNVNIFVATGGTLARKIILDNRPKAIIAVACERDLTSGVQDVKKIPVLGVFNKRPNGPCVDTSIDILEIENAIKFFTNTK